MRAADWPMRQGGQAVSVFSLRLAAMRTHCRPDTGGGGWRRTHGRAAEALPAETGSNGSAAYFIQLWLMATAEPARPLVRETGRAVAVWAATASLLLGFLEGHQEVFGSCRRGELRRAGLVA